MSSKLQLYRQRAAAMRARVTERAEMGLEVLTGVASAGAVAAGVTKGMIPATVGNGIPVYVIPGGVALFAAFQSRKYSGQFAHVATAQLSLAAAALTARMLAPAS